MGEEQAQGLSGAELRASIGKVADFLQSPLWEVRKQGAELAVALTQTEPGWLHRFAEVVGTDGWRGNRYRWGEMGAEVWRRLRDNRAKHPGLSDEALWDLEWHCAPPLDSSRWDYIGAIVTAHREASEHELTRAVMLYATNILPDSSRRTKARRLAKLLLGVTP